MTKADKVRALLKQAATLGERAAAGAALRRLIQGGATGVQAFEFDITALVLSRVPIEGWEMRLLRRAWDLDEVLVKMGVEYRWNPTNDVYFPVPLRVTSDD
jgi:hypothetical protein